jgi:Tol biopolymer transport system component
VFVAPGYLLWTSRGTLLARRFDLQRLEFAGETQMVATNVAHGTNAGWTGVSTSSNGSVVYQSMSTSTSQPTWFSREGRRTTAAIPKGSYGSLSLAPDQMHVALRVKTSEGPEGLWQLDLHRGILSKLTADAPATDAVWSPDSRWIVFAKHDQGAFRLFRKLASGGSEEPVLASVSSPMPSAGKQIPSDWSSDGRTLLFEEGGDIWMLSTDKGGQPQVLVHGPAGEGEGKLSPNQKWIVFSSDTSNRREIYIASMSNIERRWQISSLGGRDPHWRSDGGEVFYAAADGTLMAVRLKEQAETLQVAAPVALFNLEVDPLDTSSFVVSRDGQKFLVNRLVEATASRTTILFNFNWANR